MDPFIGEIKMWSFNWAPRGWLLCDGSEVLVSQNQALFALLGNAFGTPSSNTKFKLPDLRGRTPIGTGQSTDISGLVYQQGNAVGSETVTLTASTVPSHTHQLVAYQADGTQIFPANTGGLANVVRSVATTTQQFNVYQPASSPTILDPRKLGTPDKPAVAVVGGGAGHNNMQPFQVVNFCIASVGIFPPHP